VKSVSGKFSIDFTCKNCGVFVCAMPDSPLATAELCSKCYRTELKVGHLTPIYKHGLFQGFKEDEKQ